MHKKIKETSGVYKSNTGRKIQDSNGNIILDCYGKIKVYKEYINDFLKSRIDP